MKAYRCRVCDNPLYFENSLCVSCGTSLGYSRAERAIVPVDEKGQYVDLAGLVWHVCRNLNLHGCTWLSTLEGGQCFSCDLTRTRPSDDDVVGLENYPAAERAKRHLVVELDTLGFEVIGTQNQPDGSTPPAPPPATPFDAVLQRWLVLAEAVNQINRCMGLRDLYPFVIPAPVLDKLDFVADLPRSPHA